MYCRLYIICKSILHLNIISLNIYSSGRFYWRNFDSSIRMVLFACEAFWFSADSRIVDAENIVYQFFLIQHVEFCIKCHSWKHKEKGTTIKRQPIQSWLLWWRWFFMCKSRGRPWMPNMLWILQHCREHSLRLVVWPHNVQELYLRSSVGCCQVPNPSHPAASLHLMSLVQPIIFPAGVQGQPQVPAQELLSALDGWDHEWRKSKVPFLWSRGTPISMSLQWWHQFKSTPPKSPYGTGRDLFCQR